MAPKDGYNKIVFKYAFYTPTRLHSVLAFSLCHKSAGVAKSANRGAHAAADRY